jgi:hypothetical protein
MSHTCEELQSLIRACDESAKTHITYARRAHTDFQRLFHERRAAEALLKADRYRQQIQHLQNPDPKGNVETVR